MAMNNQSQKADAGYTPGERGRVAADQSQKADAGKTDPLLLEEDLSDALALTNRVLDYGVEKYGQRAGWKQVDPARYRAAMARHRRAAAQDPLSVDEESGLLHLAHHAANALFLLHFAMKEAPHFDHLRYNKPVKVGLAAMNAGVVGTFVRNTPLPSSCGSPAVCGGHKSTNWCGYC